MVAREQPQNTFLIQVGQWGEGTAQWVGETVGWGLYLSAAPLILSRRRTRTLPFARLTSLLQVYPL